MLKNRKLQLLIGIILILFSIYSYPVSASWYDNSYQYRTCSNAQNFSIPYTRNITWHAGIGTNNLTDIYFNNHANSNLSDIRIIGSNLSTFPIWYNENKLWGNITSNESGICVYYGNPSAKNITNGSATFRFFDDFNGNLNNWTVYGNTVISNGYLVITGSNAWDANGVISIYTIGRPAIIEITEYSLSTIDAQFFYTNTFNVNTGYVVYKTTSPPNTLMSNYLGFGKGQTTFTSNEKDTEKLIINDGTTFDLYRNTTQINTVAAGAGEDNYKISAQIYQNAQTLNIDTVKVRQWVKNEPSWNYWGIEESAPIINITSWGNSITNDLNLFPNTTGKNLSISFNVTNDQIPITYTWKINGTNQNINNSLINHIFNFTSIFYINLSVNDTNGNVAYKNWTLNYTQLNFSSFIASEFISNCYEKIFFNNTDKGLMGTGERLNNTLYWNNDTNLYVFIFSHNPLPIDVDVDIFINETKIQDDDVHTTVNNNNRSKWFIVPVNSNYRVEFGSGSHHIEWRESKSGLEISGCFLNENIVYLKSNNKLYAIYNGNILFKNIFENNISIVKTFFSNYLYITSNNILYKLDKFNGSIIYKIVLLENINDIQLQNKNLFILSKNYLITIDYDGNILYKTYLNDEIKFIDLLITS